MDELERIDELLREAHAQLKNQTIKSEREREIEMIRQDYNARARLIRS